MSHSAQQIRFCSSRDGARIAYATCGTGPPLVFAAHWLHHLRFDWDSPVWSPWLSLLSRRHTLIRYDWRGCGLSDREGIEFSFEKYVDDLEAVVAASEVRRFVLFGIAGGAAAAVACAVRHAGQVTHLILYECQSQGLLARNPTPEQLEEAETRLKAIELGWSSKIPAFGQFFPMLHIPDASPEQARAYKDLLHRTTSQTNTVSLMRTFHRLDVREIVPKVRCPTLVLHSRENAIIPFEEGRRVAGLIPGARFVSLESRNHVLLDTEPAWPQFVEALDEFLSTPSAGLDDAGDLPLDDLTAREHEVLELIAQGLDNDTIGKRLNISKRTARNHVSAILAKLEVESRAQAIVRAREAGLGRKTSR